MPLKTAWRGPTISFIAFRTIPGDRAESSRFQIELMHTPAFQFDDDHLTVRSKVHTERGM